MPRLPGFTASSGTAASAAGQEEQTRLGGDGDRERQPYGEGSASPASSFGAARTARDGSSASSSLAGLAGGDEEAGWDQGRYSLRWLPAEGLAALQAAGAACGMDRAALDAAAAAEEEEARAAEARAAAEAEAERAAAEAEADRAAYEAAANGTGPVMWGYDGYYDGGAAAAAATVVKRPRAKRPRTKRRKRETHVLVSESEDEGANTTTSVWAGLEEAAKAEAKAIIDYRKR